MSTHDKYSRNSNYESDNFEFNVLSVRFNFIELYKNCYGLILNCTKWFKVSNGYIHTWIPNLEQHLWGKELPCVHKIWFNSIDLWFIDSFHCFMFNFQLSKVTLYRDEYFTFFCLSEVFCCVIFVMIYTSTVYIYRYYMHNMHNTCWWFDYVQYVKL